MHPGVELLLIALAIWLLARRAHMVAPRAGVTHAVVAAGLAVAVR